MLRLGSTRPRTAPPAPVPSGTRGEVVFVLGVLLASLLVRLALAALVPLLSAEAYYWSWSLRPAPGYVDHPPGVAALIALGTALFGHGQLGLRAGALLAGTLSAALMYAFARQVAGTTAARRSLLLFCVAPFALPFSFLSTPDAPLLLFWLAALVAFLAAVRTGAWGWWLAAGAAAGLATLSKYNGLQLVLVFGAFLLLHRQARRLLATPRPWAALAIASLVVLPNLLWDARHGGDTAATPLRDGLETERALVHLVQLLALPLLLLTPLVALAAFWRAGAWWRAGRWLHDDGFRLALLSGVLPLLCFVPVAVLTQVHAHWVATAMVGLVPIALAPAAGGGPGLRFTRVALGVAVLPLLAVLAAAPMALALARSDDPPEVARRVEFELALHDALAARLRAELDRHADARVFLATDDYRPASLLRWLTGDRVDVLPVKRHRFRQLEHWYDPMRYAGRDALYVEKSPERDTLDVLQRAFRSFEALPSEPVMAGGRIVGEIRLWVCRGFRGPL